MVNRITEKELKTLGLKIGDMIQVCEGVFQNGEKIVSCEIESIFCSKDGSWCTISINVPDGSGQASVDCMINGIWYEKDGLE